MNKTNYPVGSQPSPLPYPQQLSLPLTNIDHTNPLMTDCRCNDSIQVRSKSDNNSVTSKDLSFYINDYVSKTSVKMSEVPLKSKMVKDDINLLNVTDLKPMHNRSVKSKVKKIGNNEMILSDDSEQTKGKSRFELMIEELTKIQEGYHDIQ